MVSIAEEADWQKAAPRWWLITVIVTLGSIAVWFGGKWVSNVEAQVSKVPTLAQDQEDTRKTLRRLELTMAQMSEDQVRQALYEAKRHHDRAAQEFWQSRLDALKK